MTYTNVKSVTKSVTPHVTLPSTVAERVEEILNSDKDNTQTPSVAKVTEYLQPTEQSRAPMNQQYSTALSGKLGYPAQPPKSPNAQQITPTGWSTNLPPAPPPPVSIILVKSKPGMSINY